MAKKNKSRDEAPPKSSGKGVRVRAVLDGNADDVAQRIGHNPTAVEDDAPEEPPAPPPPPNYVEALANANNEIVVKRIAPRRVPGYSRPINVEVLRMTGPIRPDELEDQVFSDHGGVQYQVFIKNPETDKVIVAKTIRRDCDVILTDEQQEDMLKESGEAPPSSDDSPGDGQDPNDPVSQLEAALAKQTRLATARLNYEQTKKNLEDLTAGSNGKVSPELAVLQTQLAEMKRLLEKRERDAEIEALRAELAAVKNAKPSGESETLKLLIQQMSEDRKAAEKRFEAMQAQIANNQIQQLSHKVDQMATRNRPSAGVLDSLGEFMEFAKLLGLKVPGLAGAGGDDEPAGGDEGDEETWLGKLLPKEGWSVINKAIDLFAAKKGVTATEADKQAMIERMRAEEIARRRAAGLPVPAPRAPIPGRPPLPIVPRQVPSELPPPGMSAAEWAARQNGTTQPAASPAPPTAGTPPVTGLGGDNDTAYGGAGSADGGLPSGDIPEMPGADAVRVPDEVIPPIDKTATETVPGNVLPMVLPPGADAPPVDLESRKVLALQFLSLLQTEVRLLQREYSWNVEAFKHLPIDWRDAMAKSDNAAELLAVFKPYSNAAAVDELLAEIEADPRRVRWLLAGLDDFKYWEEEAAKDPEFDPEVEEDEDPDDTDRDGHDGIHHGPEDEPAPAGDATGETTEPPGGVDT